MARSPHDHRDSEAETNKKQESHVLLLLFTPGLGNMRRMEGKMSTFFSSISISHSVFSTRMKWSSGNSPATILPLGSGFSPLQSSAHIPQMFPPLVQVKSPLLEPHSFESTISQTKWVCSTARCLKKCKF